MSHIPTEQNGVYRLVEAKDREIEKLRKDALYMAYVWKQYRNEFSGIVDDSGGDSNGVDFVVDRILESESQ